MADKEPVYNRESKSNRYLPLNPPKNPEYYIIPEAQAERAFKDWRDITKTTNANRFESFKRTNQRILKTVYGGSGHGNDVLHSSGYTEKYGPFMVGVTKTGEGGVAIKGEDVRLIPGTKEYFEFDHYNGQPKKQREIMLEKVSRVVEREKIKVEEKKDDKLPMTEMEEYEAERKKLIREDAIAEATGKPEISKVLKDQALGGDSTGIEIGTSLSELNEKDLENTEGGDQTNTENFVPPIETDKPDPKTKVPPIIINHSECGHLTFGDEKDGETERPRDVGLYAGDSNALRLFRDGGFELRSSESAGENKIRGSSIMQVCNNATLLVNSEGDVTIRARNKLRLVADLIEIEAKNASTDGVTIMAEHDIKLRANNNTIITSDNITIDAKERILSHSQGWQVLIGQYIRLHEPQTKICPAFLKEYIDGQIKTLRN